MHDNPAKLSPRELEVELLARYGASNKEMARILGVEVNTIKSFVADIRAKYRKIGLDKTKPYMMSPQEYDNLLQAALQKHRANVKARNNFGEVAHA